MWNRTPVVSLLATVAAFSAPRALPAEESATAGPFRISAYKEHRVRILSNRLAYSVVMGGSVDMDSTTTRRHETFHVAFQPNLSLEIANTGDRTVVNPRLVIGDRGRWWSMEALLSEILAGATDEQEKALLIWDFVRRQRHHDAPIFQRDELHDPVKLLSVYGGGLCDDAGAVGFSLLHHAGLGARGRHLHGHMMCEALVGGRYQFLDIDQGAFYLDRENERPVSGDELARDHELVKREHAYGPVFQGWETGERAAALFGADDGTWVRAVGGHRIDLALRPGEKIVYRWDDVGKFASDSSVERRRFWGNSLHVYSPRLGFDDYRKGVASARGIVAAPAGSRGKLAGKASDAELVYEMRSPYVACGGRLRARFLGEEPADRFAVSLSLDGRSWKEVWSQSGQGSLDCRVDLDPHLEVRGAPAKYRYLVKISLGSVSPGSAQIAELRIETDLMAAPLALPRLRLGRNDVRYQDDSQEPHEVTVTHRWRESDNVTPPPPPGQPEFPADGSTVRASTFEFRWPGVGDARRYHIRVSRRSDMRLPYRPSFDLVVDRPAHGSPFGGMFSPDTDYHWQVRSCGVSGAWGPWSDVWRFRWDGPRVPVDLGYRIGKGGEIVIFWKLNPRGPRPRHYDVYGSDERGFSVSKTPYRVLGLGEQPANFVARTAATEMRVVGADGGNTAGRNRSFYRVVAIDSHGTESGPSDQVELPHPYIWSAPRTDASAGGVYRYEVRTLRSLGDLQHRYAEPSQRFWEREEYQFELEKGPGWLELDEKSGVLSGRPRATDAGSHRVEIIVRRKFPHEIGPEAPSGALFQKSAARFQAADRQEFTICVRPARR